MTSHDDFVFLFGVHREGFEKIFIRTRQKAGRSLIRHRIIFRLTPNIALK